MGVTLFLIGLLLFLQAFPTFRDMGIRFFTTSNWSSTEYGAAAILYWTAVIAVIALVFSVPVAITTAIFITDYAPPRIQRWLVSLIDLLAAVPSLIFGLWGFFFLQPKLIPFAQWLNEHLGWIPIFHVDLPLFSSSAFIAGTVVALMVLPIQTSIMREVFSRTPPAEKEAALALGGTRFDMIRMVVLPFGRGGIIGGSMLGLGRALGETVAVAMIISPLYTIRPNILQLGANSVAAQIFLKFGEANAQQRSALMALGFSLFVLTLLVNTGATAIVNRSRSAAGVEA